MGGGFQAEYSVNKPQRQEADSWNFMLGWKMGIGLER